MSRLLRSSARLGAVAVPLLWSAALGAQARGLDESDVMRLKAVGGVAMSPDGNRVLYAVSAWEHPNARGDTALGDTHDRRSHVFIDRKSVV